LNLSLDSLQLPLLLSWRMAEVPVSKTFLRCVQFAFDFILPSAFPTLTSFTPNSQLELNAPALRVFESFFRQFPVVVAQHRL